MPALTSYSPYETLLFLQNVAQYGSDTSSLQTISASLNANQLIRESKSYDATKFSPDALLRLYESAVKVPKDGSSNGINGDSSMVDADQPKSKPPSPAPSIKPDHDDILLQVVDRLYAKFKDDTIRELRQQEEDYQKLQGEIEHLEEKAKAQATAPQTAEAWNPKSEEATAPDVQAETADPVAAQLQASLDAAESQTNTAQSAPTQPAQPAGPAPVDRPQHSPAPHPRASTPRSGSASGTPQQRHAQPPAQPPASTQPQQLPSPNNFSRALPPPSPGRNSYGAVPVPTHTYPPQPLRQQSPSMLPPVHGMPSIPSHDAYHPRAPTQGRGSPLPQNHHHQPYTQYPLYQQSPPQGWHSAGLQYPPQQFSPQPYPGQPAPQPQYAQLHTPSQPHHQPYPHTAPMPYQSQQQWRPHSVQQHQQYTVSASTTPVPLPSSRTAVLRSALSTPWKSKTTPVAPRARSPSRLDRDVSPLSDHGSPPESPGEKAWAARQEKGQERLSLPRDDSATPATNGSRAQSIISTTSEAGEAHKRRPSRPIRVKPESPSTPALTISDTEQQQRSSGRRGRSRAEPSVVKHEPTRTATNKRKRDATSLSPPAGARSSSHVQPPSSQHHFTRHDDACLVMVSKTFPRTSGLLLNEIASHKVAGIFAKPLSERDAPGYKSLVHRPQDLKSIKAAIGKGSRAAVAAIEEVEGKNDSKEVQDDSELTPSPTPKNLAAGKGTSKPGPIGNGFYLVKATEDLVPPKGIVNFAQLEMELIRMFANAVMFNPLPASERGFGRSLRLRKRGGKPRIEGAQKLHGDDDDSEDEADKHERERSESATTTTVTSESELSAEIGSDEERIISDTREMFQDVEQLVARWRELEGEKMAGNNYAQATLMTIQQERQVSVSASSAAGEEGHEHEGTPTASTLGSVRKRRRVGDH